MAVSDARVILMAKLLPILGISLFLIGCTSDQPHNGSNGGPSGFMRNHVAATESWKATSLIPSGSDPHPSDCSLIDANIQQYKKRGFDDKRARQNATDDFIGAAGRFPNQ